MSNTYFNISDKLRLYEFDGMLDKYGDATAAYSLRKLRNGYTGNAIRVRRSSDDAERDMGFYDNELDTAALLSWVNEEILHFDADLNDPTGWIFNGATMGAGSIDFTNSNSTLGAYKGYGAIPYEKVRVTFTIANYVSGQISWANYGGGAQDAEWKTADGTYVKERVLGNGNLNWGFWTNGGFTGSITEFRVEIIGSNGLVQTWYDQSANANHAVQGTESAQPKIVDAGTLVTVNDKPAVLGDGVDDFITSANVGTFPSPLTVTTVYDPVVEAGTLGGVYNGGSHGPGFLVNYANGGFMAYQQGPELTPGIFTPNQSLMFFKSSTTGIDWKLYINSVEILNSGEDIGVSVGNKITLFSRGGATQFSNANIQEFIVYGSDKTLDRTTIEANINNHYNIY